MNTSLEQDLLLEQTPVTSLDIPIKDTIQEKVPASINTSSISMYLMLSVYLLIPILSVEGLIGWSIGIIGAYKTVNIYRNPEKADSKKALRLLAINVAIALIYNILVYYVTKILVSKLA